MPLTPAGSQIDNSGGAGGGGGSTPDQIENNSSVITTPFTLNTLINGISPNGVVKVNSTTVDTLATIPRRQTLVVAGGTSSFQTLGEGSPGSAGSPNAETGAWSTSNGIYGASIYMTTGSGSATIGWDGSNAFYFVGRNIAFNIIAYLNGLLTSRYWFALTNQTLATMGASDNPAGIYAGFRFSPSTAGDVYWQCITKDNVTQNIISSGIVPNGPFITHSYSIVFNDGVPNVQFYIDKELVATSVSHLPVVRTPLQWVASTFAVSDASNGLGVGQVSIQSDF